MNFHVLQTWNTLYCADTVEWCPHVPYQHYFACGTYELQKQSESSDEDQIRLGQLHIFSVSKDLTLILHYTANSSGILDIKWCPTVISNRILLATANADGRIIIWRLTADAQSSEGGQFVTPVCESKIDAANVPTLSLEWSVDGSDVLLCASNASGQVFVLKLEEDTLKSTSQLKPHNYEAWIATFGVESSSMLYTGGDDCVLKITDLRLGYPVRQLREHGAGVTSIRFHPKQSFTFASGSYDETIKLWDTRQLSRSISTLNIGGGVWRIKWDPDDGERGVLVAAMYSGFYWCTFDRNDGIFDGKHEFKEHESIAYGADICHAFDLKTRYSGSRVDFDRSTKLATTCSFYDKKLCLFAVK